MERLSKLLILVLMVTTLGACISPRHIQLREGIDHFRLEEFRKAFIRLKPLAENGNPEAQYAVGYMYYYGQGVIEDRKKAWFWIHAAANLGNPDAKVALNILATGQPLS
jgi:TPR repeat protein